MQAKTRKFQSNWWRFSECQIYHRDIGKKQSTQCWVGEGEIQKPSFEGIVILRYFKDLETIPLGFRYEKSQNPL